MNKMKDIPGYEGKYAVTEEGQVWSYKHKKFLKPKVVNGYLMVDLFKSRDARKHQVSVHRCVALTYIPNPDNLPCVNHKDECRTNPHKDNLEWCTHKYNSNYGTGIQRLKANKTASGYERARKASIEALRKPVKCVELNTVFYSAADAVRKLNLTHNHIGECCSGRRSTTGGYHWEPVDKEAVKCE